jgi:hypothetical protein
MISNDCIYIRIAKNIAINVDIGELPDDRICQAYERDPNIETNFEKKKKTLHLVSGLSCGLAEQQQRVQKDKETIVKFDASETRFKSTTTPTTCRQGDAEAHDAAAYDDAATSRQRAARPPEAAEEAPRSPLP